MRRIELNLNKMQSEREIQDFFKEQMPFLEYKGDSLEALGYMLTEITENICVDLSLMTDTLSPLYEYTKKLERVMENAAQTVEYTEDGRMFAVFADYETLDIGSAW